MAKIKIIVDYAGKTLTVHFNEMTQNQTCEELDDGTILIKDPSTGRVLGFEQLHYECNEEEPLVIESSSISKSLS